MSDPRCRIVPLPQGRVSFQVDGVELTRWHAQDRFANDAPRPYFFPLVGPSGDSVTRMGHPGAPNHDHHRSVWFAHHKVLGDPGISFWSDNTDTRIRQAEWMCFHDADDECVLAAKLHWLDGHNPKPLIEHELVASVRPATPAHRAGKFHVKHGWFLELQSTFTPTAETLDLAKTNFGILGVRVAKRISAYFGSGNITDSENRKGEPAIFGKSAKWMDYSNRVEGITVFDHPANINHPANWHVREDGWIGPSLCRDKTITLQKKSPLVIRYLLSIHPSVPAKDEWNAVFAAFARSNPFRVTRSRKKHTHAEVSRT